MARLSHLSTKTSKPHPRTATGLLRVLSTGLLVIAGAGLLTAAQDRVEYEATNGTTGYRRLVTRQESAKRTVETWVVEAGSPSGDYSPLLEVEEETVQIDATRSQVTRREYTTDANGRQVLLGSIAEERVEQADGGTRVQRDISETDANGRSRLTRQETEVTTVSPDGTFQTQTDVLRPGINERGFVPTERVVETGRRDSEDRVVESDLVSYSARTGNGGWEALERRITTYSYDDIETTTTENLYRRNASGDLALNEQVVSREWVESGGIERSTEAVYSTNIPGERSLREPRLLRQVETTRTESPDGGWEVTREVSESRNGRFRVVERETESARTNRSGGIDLERNLQRLDANGRLRTVSTSSSSTSGS